MRTTPIRRYKKSLIRGLQNFEAVARHGSIGAAATELGVSQSAVSHQIVGLSKALGERLLVRKGRGVTLTFKGQQLAARLTEAFADMEAIIEETVGGKEKTVVKLTVCSSFGPGWLIPRLADLIEANPELQIQLNMSTQQPDPSDQVADAFVTALPVPQGYQFIHVMNERLVSVAAATSRHSKGPLITTEFGPAGLGLDWINYCAHIDIDLASIHSGTWLRSSHFLLASEMARSGLGAALIPDFLAQRDIESGALVRLHKSSIGSGRIYNLCFKQARAKEPRIMTLTRWFRAQSEIASNF